MFNTKLTLLKNSKYASGFYPVMIRVSKKGTKRPVYISTGVSCLSTQWSKKDSRLLKNFKNHNRTNNLLNEKLSHARQLAQLIESANTFMSLPEFKKRYKDLERRKFKSKYDLFEYIEKRIADITIISTRENYENLLSSLKSFSTERREFSDITPEYLDQFCTHLKLKKKNTSNTIWGKLTTLKATFNHAIKNNYCPSNLNPFLNYSISKMKKETVKRALSENQFDLIRNVDVSNRPHLLITKYYIIFSYYTRGMNFSDMAGLTWNESIKGNKIVYDRNKTGKLFKIKILKPVQEVLDYFSNIRTSKYIFPIMPSEKLTPEQIRTRLNNQRAKSKRHLDEICKICGISENVTMYWFRHTFATKLLREKVDLDLARQALGHESLTTTQVYLKSLSNDELDDAIENILV